MIIIHVKNKKEKGYGTYYLPDNQNPSVDQTNQDLLKKIDKDKFMASYKPEQGKINQNLRLLSMLYQEINLNSELKLCQCKCIGRKGLDLFYIVVLDTDVSQLNFKYFKVATLDKIKKMDNKLKLYQKRVKIGLKQALSNAIWSQIKVSDIIIFIIEFILFIMSFILIFMEKTNGNIKFTFQDCSSSSFQTMGIFILSIAVLLFGKIEQIIVKIVKGYEFKKYCQSITKEEGIKRQDLISKMNENKTKLYQDFEMMAFYKGNNIIEAFFYSKVENKSFDNNAAQLRVELTKRKSHLSSDSQKALAFVVNERTSNLKTIFNGKLLGIDSDLVFSKIGKVWIKKVQYHHYVAIDDMVFKNLMSAEDPTYFVSGASLTLNPLTKGLRDIKSSALTNLIGINLMVELKVDDNLSYYIINQQSLYNDVNNNLFVPSSSGSLEQSDYKVFTRNKNNNFKELLKIGMLRELREESYLVLNNNDNFDFKLLGFARLASKAGKPDFFAKLVLKIKSEEELKQILNHYDIKQNENVGFFKTELETSRMVLIEKNTFLNNEWFETNVCSPQLRYMRFLLKEDKTIESEKK